MQISSTVEKVFGPSEIQLKLKLECDANLPQKLGHSIIPLRDSSFERVNLLSFDHRRVEPFELIDSTNDLLSFFSVKTSLSLFVPPPAQTLFLFTFRAFQLSGFLLVLLFTIHRSVILLAFSR